MGINELTLLLLIVGVVFLPAIPGYTLAKRRGLRAPGLAFVPLVGLWIIVFRSIGWTGWLLGVLVAIVVALPFAGLGAIAWAGIKVPVAHRRSRWWTVVLAVPGVNLVGYWVYAFTLPNPDSLSLSYG
jgi:hypothetical protein